VQPVAAAVVEPVQDGADRPRERIGEKQQHDVVADAHRHGNVDIRVLQEILGHENLGTT